MSFRPKRKRILNRIMTVAVSLAFTSYTLLHLTACTRQNTQALSTSYGTAADKNTLAEDAILVREIENLLPLIKDARELGDTALLQQIEIEAARRESETLNKAQDLSQKNEWAQAIKTLNTIQKGIPDSESISQAIEQIRQQQDAHLLRARTFEAIENGRWIAKKLELYKLLAKSTEASLLTKLELRHLRKEQRRLTQLLLKYGHLAIQNHQHLLAQRCYATMSRLSITEDLQAEYLSLGEAIDTAPPEGTPNESDQTAAENAAVAAQQQAKRAKRASTKERASKLMADLDTAIHHGDLFEIHRFINELRKMPALSQEQKNKVDLVESFLGEQVFLMDKQADTLYQAGNILEARTLWELSLKLRPGDATIEQKRLRADRVLENMETLREEGHQLTTEAQDKAGQ